MPGCTIQNLQLRAEISPEGAELTAFRMVGGPDLLWGGDPAVWPRQAPHLFPVVGRLRGDRLRQGGREYPMPKHGFARDSRFRRIRLTRENATFVLRDSEATRAIYPFPFELRVTYALDALTLQVTYEVLNPGPEPLPMSLGAHPAFRWPLLPDLPREGHVIKFELPEREPIRRLDPVGLLRPEPQPTPVVERLLELKDDLFREDVLVFDRLRSRRLRFESPGGLGLQVEWRGFQHLGIWTRPGAPFLCIEPWQGMASEASFDGEFSTKPGVVLIPPASQRAFAYAVTVLTET
jgi:galactose mutarotase-like enzyme